VVNGVNTLSNLSKNRDLKRKKEQTISDLKRIRSTLDNKLNVIDMELSLLITTEEVSCPSCGQSLTDEHRNKEIETKKTKREEVRIALLDVDKRISVEEKFIVDNKLTNVETDYESFQSVLNEHRQKLAVSEKMIERLVSDAEKIKKSQQNLQSEQDTLDELEVKCEVAKKHYDEKQDEQKLLSSAQGILKDSGIKTRVIKHYLPIMNKLINHYLACMDFFVQFNLDESFNETIKSRHRDEFTYASFSEGEKMRIDLSLLLAWREIARLKNSTNCNILVLDEVFDSSLDSTGMDEFMKLIRTLGKRCNVFVISHKTDQLMDKFQDVLTFSKKNNFSRINQ